MCCSCGGGTIASTYALTSGIAPTFASYYPTLCGLSYHFDNDGYSRVRHDTCTNTNVDSSGSATTDSNSNDCSWYDTRYDAAYSGEGCPTSNNDGDFTAATMCCACGGGTSPTTNDLVIRAAPPTSLDDIGTYIIKTKACYTNFPEVCSPDVITTLTISGPCAVANIAPLNILTAHQTPSIYVF